MTTTPISLTMERRSSPGGSLIRVVGPIDDRFDVDKFVEGLSGVVVIDLGGAESITSFGVRKWITAIRRLSGLTYVGVVNCRPMIVTQVNMVRDFLGSAELVSLYLAYRCTECQHGFEVLADARQRYVELTQGDVPNERCPDCGGTAEFDDLPEVYFAHLASRPPPAPPPTFDSVLAGHTPTGLRMEKVIEREWTGLFLEGVLDGRNYFKRASDGLDGPLLLNFAKVRSFSVGGLDRLAEFLNGIIVPVVIHEASLELAVALSERGLLQRNVSVLKVRAPYLCAMHPELELAVAPSDVASTGTCPRCGEPVTPGFSTSEAALLRGFPQADLTAGLGAVLSAQNEASQRATDPDETRDAPPGAVLMQRYTLLRRLGSGGMAEVFLARQTSLGGFEKQVVVKRILRHLASDPVFVDMFLAEARLSAKLNHPNIVQIFDVGREGSHHFIVMEYVPGADLRTLLRAARDLNEPCPVPIACRIGASICLALDAAHQHTEEYGQRVAIVHRDVSPHNVLVSSTGVAKLSDFGIAKALDGATLTPTTTVRGKMPYVAPEVILQGSRLGSSPAMDVYAAGLVVFEMLTGSNPFKRDTDVETLSAIVKTTAPRLVTVRPDVPPALDELVFSTLEKNPENRPTAQELATSIEEFLARAHIAAGVSELSTWVRHLVAEVPAAR